MNTRTHDIAFTQTNLPPAPGARRKSIEDTIQFCSFLENIDALQFCDMVDKLPLTRPDEKASSSTPELVESTCAHKSAVFPEITKSATQQPTSNLPTKLLLHTEQQQESKCRFQPFHEERWDQKLLELRAFRKKHGHCLVPHLYPLNPQLARWVKRQRRQFKLMQDGRPSAMTLERAEILEQDGFVWDSHEAAWKEKIDQLRKYRAKHGDCLVPSNYKGNPQLATWVKCQRRQYKLFREGQKSSMNSTRITELETEGFCWELRRNAIPMKEANYNSICPLKAELKHTDDFPLNLSELHVLQGIISML